MLIDFVYLFGLNSIDRSDACKNVIPSLIPQFTSAAIFVPPIEFE